MWIEERNIDHCGTVMAERVFLSLVGHPPHSTEYAGYNGRI